MCVLLNAFSLPYNYSSFFYKSFLCFFAWKAFFVEPVWCSFLIFLSQSQKVKTMDILLKDDLLEVLLLFGWFSND